ncbi:PucR family transcriptional regulator [Paenibacillus abyssi]|uniref:Purine catabolism regulatory protein n=1 Tax=Paenibacillus abyssi TaxID=1340531 RepID=A0A917LEM8_9BACL|nr:PucR family transcriptional regulator [Paenibacillus abyssi]GGG17143.1 purine catabolism regulatory protein [Paenibacillus abyssi]
MEELMGQGLTVKDLLTIPHFKEAVLLGGSSGLEQLVSRINVMEVPDVVDWVRPGEFLMTTGYSFRNEPEIMETLIAELVQKGVVALGIKTKRFVDTVPETAIAAANAHGLPLIELPPDTAFSDVVREVMERVLVAESRHLSTLQSRVQRLSHVLLHGDGLSAFLHHLQLLVKNPVLLLDPNNRWTASPGAEYFCRQIEEAQWQKLREDRTLETGFIQIADRYIRVHISAVPDKQTYPFLLVMMETEQEYGIVDTLTVNWASEFVGFEISNAQARKRIETKYIDQFIQDWMAGRIVSPVDLRLRAEACGCPIDDSSSYVAGVVSFHDKKPAVNELQEIARRMNWDASAGSNAARWTVLEEDLAVLFTLRGQDMPGSALASLRQIFPDRHIQLCLGREAPGQSEVPASFREAKRAAEVSLVCKVAGETLHYGDLGVYLLLYRLQGSEELEEFKRTYLEPLLQYDEKHQGALLNTLRTYFLCNGNAKETAERLFLHYNTVNYRLERIRGELGLRLDDPEVRLQLQLAIKLYEIKEH